MRHAAVILKKFASSIAPHITTILVHGKQVMFGQRWIQDAACFPPVCWLASCLVRELCELQPYELCDSSEPRLLESHREELVIFSLQICVRRTKSQYFYTLMTVRD